MLFLYSRMNRISVASFFHQLESIAGREKACGIFELVKLNCPIELYSEIELFFQSSM